MRNFTCSACLNTLWYCIIQVKSFIDTIEGSTTLYGYREQTLYSLMLLVLPWKLTLFNIEEVEYYDVASFQDNKQLFFHTLLLRCLDISGLNIIQVRDLTWFTKSCRRVTFFLFFSLMLM